MTGNNKPLILASQSPRRHSLLSQMGYAFEICVPDVDEHAEGTPRDIVLTLARRKARAVAAQYERGVIIASDTLVSIDGEPLGKPADEKDAANMLQRLSGREHEVFTGVCVIDASTGEECAEVARTGVLFDTLTPSDILRYVATGEPMDKAGAYGIQGEAGRFVLSLDGSYENVVGFPTDLVAALLANFSV